MSVSKASKVAYNLAQFNEIKRVVDKSFNGYFTKVAQRVSKNVQDVVTPKSGPAKVARNLFESLTYPVLGLPRDIFEFTVRKLGGKFPRSSLMSKLNKWQALNNYGNRKEIQQAERVLRGMYGELSSPKVKDICDEVFDRLNKNAAPGVAKYNTRDGEGLKRLVTALIPIPFLFKDSFYISKKNNMSDDEARKQAWNKANQELIAAGGESLSQFTILGGAPRFVNGSTFAAPIINTAIGIGFHIFSRLRTGRKLTHLSKEQVAQRIDPQKIKSFDDFKKYSAKKENLDIKEPKKDGKKRLLSFKNLLIFAATSIVGGFLLAMGKNKALEYLTKKGNEKKFLPKTFATVIKKYKSIVMEDRVGKKVLLEDLASALKRDCDAKMIDTKFAPILEKADRDGGKVVLAVVDKVVKLPFVNIQVPVKKLIELPFVPFRMLFEIASYPYKAVKSILEQVISRPSKASGVVGTARKTPREILERIGLLGKKDLNLFGARGDNYGILNFYDKYTELLEKHKGNPSKARRAFNEFFDGNFSRTFDLERTSKIDNSKIGKLTQLLGMTGSIYFATNDDYNQTLLETGSVRKAQADQRRRGVQKFTRVTTGVAISDWFNQTFIRNYNSSLFGALAVVAASTFAVDKATRLILGQPSKKLTNEQLKEYEERKQSGFMAPFRRFMDKLAK